MYEALAARRPCRQDLTTEEVLVILGRQVGAGICAAAHEALLAYLGQGTLVPVSLAA